MDALEMILTRHSIRKYENKPISAEMIETVLRAGMHAPSAGNEMPWEFVLIDDRATLDKVPGVHPYAQMITSAPVAILICGDLSREKYAGYWVQDCSAAAQNVLLAAHALGLGAVWLGIHPLVERVTGFRRLFGLPEKIVPLCLIPIGYPAENKGQDDRYDFKRVRKNHW